jgi:DNA-binding transcriptional MerR regulator/methylmalonyl-CoA mutase cobalamin-binding subunit
METPALRIGAVSRRTGVAVATLRAWESRYGVLLPSRTEGGHRLYSEEDVDRVLAVLRLTSQGWSVGAAAASVTAERTPRLGLVGDPAGPVMDPPTWRASDVTAIRAREDLARAVRTFDGSAAEDALDAAIARVGVALALETVVMPVLRDLGEGWQDDPSLIAAEHFATNTLRPRLLRLMSAARSAAAPRCVAAAPEPEDHELGVLAAAAVAADLGFRVTYLGARTPSIALERSVATIRPDVVLVGAVTSRAGRAFCDALPELGDARLVVGGPGFAGLEAALPPGTGRAAALTDLRAVLQRALARNGATG